MMSLQEAIEEVKREHKEFGEWKEDSFSTGLGHNATREAIATILNAVVKGELK